MPRSNGTKAPAIISIHEDYVDWNSSKREKMLKDLLRELDRKIAQCRERLENASMEKKNNMKSLMDHFEHKILPRYELEELELGKIKQKEQDQRASLEEKTDLTNDLKLSLKQLISPSPSKFISASPDVSSSFLTSFSCDVRHIPVMTGILYKRSDHLEQWRRRWFELTPDSLNYFYDEVASVKRNAKPRGSMKLKDIIECSLVHPNINIANPNPLRNTDTPLKVKKNDLPQILAIRTDDLSYVLASPTYRESLKWVQLIHELIEKTLVKRGDSNISNEVSAPNSCVAFSGKDEESDVDSSFESTTNIEISRETLDKDFKVCANKLEVAKEGLQTAMGEMLNIIKSRECSGQIMKSIQIASNCMMICSTAFPTQLKKTFDTLLLESSLKLKIDALVHKEKSRKVYGLNYLIQKALQYYNAHISLLSINIEECVHEVAQLYDLLRCLLTADRKKRSEWVCLEELVVQRARAEVRYRELRAHVKAFHDVKSPVKTSFIAKDMMDSFSQQGLLSPNSRNSKTYRSRHSTSSSSGGSSLSTRRSNNDNAEFFDIAL